MTSSVPELLGRGVVTTKTLADLDSKLEIECRRCARTTLFEPFELLRRFPKATPLREVGQRLRCDGCGANNPQMWVWIMGWTRDKQRRGQPNR